MSGARSYPEFIRNFSAYTILQNQETDLPTNWVEKTLRVKNGNIGKVFTKVWQRGYGTDFGPQTLPHSPQKSTTAVKNHVPARYFQNLNAHVQDFLQVSFWRLTVYTYQGGFLLPTSASHLLKIRKKNRGTTHATPRGQHFPGITGQLTSL